MMPFLLRFKVLGSDLMNTHATLLLAPSALIAASPSALLSGSRFREFKGCFFL
jgi:hypothetical protein